MKVLLVSGTALPTPPPTYGGLEAVVYDFAKGLAAAGDDVTLVATRGSQAPDKVKLITTTEPGVFDNEGLAYPSYRHLLNDFDVVGDHSWFKWAYMLGESVPVVGTMHGGVPFATLPPVKYPRLVGVSTPHSRMVAKVLKVPVRTVHNPMDISKYPFQPKLGTRLLSLNRVAPEKGIQYFVEWNKALKLEWDVVGDDRLIVQNHEYPKQIRQLAKGTPVEYHGLVAQEQKLKFLTEASAVVLLPQEPYFEVFGLAAIEALACGKPVICTKNGGLGEIVEHGVTGFFVKNIEDYRTAVKLLDQIEPRLCRERAEQFDIKVQSAVYRRVLKSAADGSEW